MPCRQFSVDMVVQVVDLFSRSRKTLSETKAYLAELVGDVSFSFPASEQLYNKEMPLNCVKLTPVISFLCVILKLPCKSLQHIKLLWKLIKKTVMYDVIIIHFGNLLIYNTCLLHIYTKN